jgi:hypothetical protein
MRNPSAIGNLRCLPPPGSSHAFGHGLGTGDTSRRAILRSARSEPRFDPWASERRGSARGVRGFDPAAGLLGLSSRRPRGWRQCSEIGRSSGTGRVGRSSRGRGFDRRGVRRALKRRSCEERSRRKVVEPGMTIEADDDVVSEELAAEMNSPQHLNRHRVIVRRPLESDPFSIAAFSGKLRHELEHARQWNACGLSVFQLSDLADSVLAPKIRGLAGGNRFIHLKPIEQDANAAAAIFLRARWPDEVTALLDDPNDGPLVRSLTPPGSTATLVTRMVAFLYLYEDLCAALEAKWPFGFAEHLDGIAPSAGALWRTLQAASATPPNEEPFGTGRQSPAETTWEEDEQR